jgi:hypothetical protein
MAYYNRVKAAKTVPIGTIIPWTGTSSPANNPDSLPKGYIICNQSAKGLKAKEYPLLAQIIGNTYGPFPEQPGQQIGVNFGIVNSYPNYDDDDVFDLPDLNQRALVDIEGDRMTTSDLTVVGQYVSENGVEGTQPLTEYKSDVNIIFEVEPSNELSGRITGITLSEATYFDTIYVIPRKLGIDHTPQHSHRAASEDEFDGIVGANATGDPVMTFNPGRYIVQEAKWTSVTPTGIYGNTSPPESFLPSDGQARITWYDPNDGGISIVQTDIRRNIADTLGIVPAVQSRVIQGFGNTAPPGGSYTDDGSGISQVQVAATTGSIPIAGQYQGRYNYHVSTDIPSSRGGGDSTHTYPTTVNHPVEDWAATGLRAHNHDAMEITMDSSNMGLPSTILVNNVSTNSAAPVSVDTAINIAVNPNTPSLTMIYIMRAY